MCHTSKDLFQGHTPPPPFLPIIIISFIHLVAESNSSSDEEPIPAVIPHVVPDPVPAVIPHVVPDPVPAVIPHVVPVPVGLLIGESLIRHV